MPLRPTRLSATLMTLAGVAALSAQDANLAERLFRSGERAYAAKSYPEALDTWNQVVQQAPKSPFAAQALLRTARHHLEVDHKPEAALPLLEKIKAEHMTSPWAAEALLMRGRILAARASKASDLREAVAEFNRVVDLFPDHPAVQSARYHLGLASRQQGHWPRALQHFTEAMRLDPASAVAPAAMLQAAETLDLMGDLQGCLRLLQGLRNQHPQSPEATEAAWRLAVRVRHRLQKPPLKSEGPWPQGKVKWLKTPTLLATGLEGDLFIYQDDLDRAFLLKGAEVAPTGPLSPDGRALVPTPGGSLWIVTRTVVAREEGSAAWPLASLGNPSGATLDGWGNLWVGDSKNPALTVFGPDGTSRTLPTPAAVALAGLPTGGAVVASDANRSLLFLDAEGQTRFTVAYGKDLPAPFKNVLALASDPTGHVAALVDGDFEGVVLWGPDGTLLRHGTYKALGLSGKFRAIALDRQGGLILADRSNDLLIRLN